MEDLERFFDQMDRDAPDRLVDHLRAGLLRIREIVPLLVTDQYAITPDGHAPTEIQKRIAEMLSKLDEAFPHDD